VFVFGYGAARFVVEYFRNPDDHLADFAMRTGLSMGQWLTIPMLLLGLYLIVTSGRRDPIMAGDTDEGEGREPRERARGAA
jgi:phosphatidylglycerol:prolipoprotein diacylglycerol transferase